jgi:succinate dehydrogenase / fumarate reductase, cytochrome b subunit
MAQPERPLSPFMHYRWQYTNTLSILHRLTGVLLSACFFLLVYWLAAAASGPDAYAGALHCLGAPLTRPVLFGGLLAFCYHLLNGVRHLSFDAIVGFNRPSARASGWAVAIASVILGVTFWFLLGASLGGAA